MTGVVSLAGCAEGAADDDGGDDTPIEAVCGDGTCTGDEDATSWASDCAGCGDGSCTGEENQNTCPLDCGSAAVCGDGTCGTGENVSNCAQDCGAQTACGDGTCNGTETMQTCPGDCTGGGGGTCGDFVCDGAETATSCPADCGGGGGGAGCGDAVCDVGAGECTSIDILCVVDCILDDQCSAAATPVTCDHDVCTEGGPLDGTCGTCAGDVCDLDPVCCTEIWDEYCVAATADVGCTPACN